MPKKYLSLILWTLLFDFSFYELEEVTQFGIGPFWDNWKSMSGLGLGLSAILVFQIYALGAYSSLYFFYKKGLKISGVGIGLSIIVGISLRCLIEEVIFPAYLGFDNFNDRLSWTTYFFTNLYYALVFAAVGTVFFFIQYTGFKEQQSQILKIENKKVELAFLRSQINPHFLFNTLNNIYTLVYQKSDQALVAMDHLTKLLRYALYEQKELVPLQSEINQIGYFIELQAMRYDFTIPLQFQVEESLKQVLIPPFSFISFIENAFKHAYLKDPSQPLIIEFKEVDQQLFFKTLNAKGPAEKDEHRGIGLENIRKRLALIYQDRQKLRIVEDEQTFEVQVQIPLV